MAVGRAGREIDPEPDPDPDPDRLLAVREALRDLLSE
jgi:hypothetical protein